MVTPVSERTPPAVAPRRARRVRRLTTRDRLVLALMLGVPSLIHLGLVWGPALASVALSFTSWDGIGGLSTIKWVGFQNYHDIVTIYPPFWPAIRHNVLWLVFFLLVPTTFGLFLAVLLDKNIRGSRIYQSILFTPVVLSLAVVGFIWTLIYSRDFGLINSLLGTAGNEAKHPVDWLGDPDLNIWAVLIAASWRHTGYIMILYLAGLKGVDPAQREAAALDGANEWQLFRHVVFPALKPVNVVVLAVTVIDSLRAFDIVYIINKGTNGLELISALVVQNIVGEASRIGYGSALAVLLLLVSSAFIVTYMVQTFREDR
ncbi:MAG: binding-protein-dependent transport system inner rane component [Actinomycetia bacterium]|jgi:multiple sugar transport system permease protein|nr:binding-protein-dependent transport system inner rane component [Actinomycetes bacterium]MDQ1658468.1 multiple sugar transport system permease protein [Cryptosporangiaceae bacterium]